MTIVLTPEQQKQLDDRTDGPPRVLDPRSGELFDLIPKKEQEVAEIEERELAAFRKLGLKTLAQRLREDW